MSDYQVIICGAGPVGLITANLLGQLGVNTLLVESRTEMYSYARAVGIDDEALRALQAAGLYMDFVGSLQLTPTIEYLSLNGYRFFSPDANIRPYGYPILSTFFQPHLESLLRNGLSRYPCVKFLQGCELIDFSQDETSVQVELKQNDIQFTAKASYLLACDGGKSMIRKQLGLALSGDTQSKAWLVVDVKDSGHLAAQIAQHHVNISPRPMVTISLPCQMRRFECMLLPTDDKQHIPTDEIISKWFSPFTNGLQLEILRKKIYDRYYRYADTFQKNRIFLLGDAAHLVPPYGGQGLCSGIRDAINLSWKIAYALKFDDRHGLLKTYETERKYHMRKTVEFVKTVASRVENPPFKKRWLSGLFKNRSIAAPVNTEQYRADKPAPSYEDGFFLKRSSYSGSMIFSLLIKKHITGQPVSLDEFSGFRFIIIGCNIDPARFLSDKYRLLWDKLDTQFIALYQHLADDNELITPGSFIAYTDDEKWASYFTQNDTVLIIRPDKFIVTTCSHYELNNVSADVLKQFFNTL